MTPLRPVVERPTTRPVTVTVTVTVWAIAVIVLLGTAATVALARRHLRDDLVAGLRSDNPTRSSTTLGKAVDIAFAECGGGVLLIVVLGVVGAYLVHRATPSTRTRPTLVWATLLAVVLAAVMAVMMSSADDASPVVTWGATVAAVIAVAGTGCAFLPTTRRWTD
ncbi:hypothetical protein SAMN05445060_0183 [Williamsia sterculiae]|uniref:Uncharacterized protein n=1 Tax=Williamsia sterculiae TaxID=1344003 RepID=A0A1N7CJW5_9NOCA|nr:hypothetical protein SAMN05445060_0183 [Williamsia sterculiae]